MYATEQMTFSFISLQREIDNSRSSMTLSLQRIGAEDLSKKIFVGGLSPSVESGEHYRIVNKCNSVAIIQKYRSDFSTIKTVN